VPNGIIWFFARAGNDVRQGVAGGRRIDRANL
jgi:hypothetical protein